MGYVLDAVRGLLAGYPERALSFHIYLVARSAAARIFTFNETFLMKHLTLN